ncbi:hypothetical protein M427DRAFT_60586 [Gonapodya prolifera JEL478]|uniref:Uncharacterized protein n=1 Tax=Gonapodya prolifera (strain JEL478) TaxID=1344416 RepID=A0A139A4Z5_GONPJ|nr:hypothetical protein M427DRAFT_60586 [Gonapodya prolifera JEL478]|eukprot:KXS11575.1 hypothetical protein M427DRAFT_60586 [Gonapodya prolifera JEL478]
MPMSPIRAAGPDAHSKPAGVVSPMRPVSASSGGAKSPLQKAPLTAPAPVSAAKKPENTGMAKSTAVHAAYPPPPNISGVIESKIDRINARRVVGELIARRAMRVENYARLDAVNAAKKVRVDQWADANKKLDGVLKRKLGDFKAGGPVPAPVKRAREEEDSDSHSSKRLRKDESIAHPVVVPESSAKSAGSSPARKTPTAASPSSAVSDAASGRKSARKASARAQEAMKDHAGDEDEDEGPAKKRARK